MPNKKTVKVKTEQPKSNPVKYVKEEDFENVYIIIKEMQKNLEFLNEKVSRLMSRVGVE